LVTSPAGKKRPVNPQEYLSGAAQRLQADGSTTGTADLPGGQALVGQQGQFKVQWLLTKLNLFTLVFPVPVVTAAALDSFSNDALQYAVDQKGHFRGLQNGVAAIAVLVGEHVEPEAAEFARKRIVKRFSAFAWPGAVDLSAGTSFSQEGAVLIGGVYAGWMRKRMRAVLGEGVRTGT
jgi:hypothetical protein